MNSRRVSRRRSPVARCPSESTGGRRRCRSRSCACSRRYRPRRRSSAPSLRKTTFIISFAKGGISHQCGVCECSLAPSSSSSSGYNAGFGETTEAAVFLTEAVHQHNQGSRVEGSARRLGTRVVVCRRGRGRRWRQDSWRHVRCGHARDRAVLALDALH